MLGHHYCRVFLCQQHFPVFSKFYRFTFNSLQTQFQIYRTMASTSGKDDNKQYDYDYFVIGGGSGGVRSSRIAAKHGARVALAEAKKLGN